MNETSPRHRTALGIPLRSYGTSENGAPLQWLPPTSGHCRLLILAGLHGEEPDTTVALSRAIRSIPVEDLANDVAVILCANPDGLLHGTRGNANGVDLNRNFPASNWSPVPSTCRWHVEDGPVLPILTGDTPASESETRALIQLIREWHPRSILSLHGPLGCIDDPHQSPLGQWLAERTLLPLVSDIGYPTPGSMGTWAEEERRHLITWEFPPESIESLSHTQVPVLAELLRGQLPYS